MGRFWSVLLTVMGRRRLTVTGQASTPHTVTGVASTPHTVTGEATIP